MFKNLFTKIVGDANEREVKGYQSTVDEINALEPEMEARSNDELRGAHG